MAEHVTTHDQADSEFRKQSRWLSFKGALYGALSGATFFGVLAKLVIMAVDKVAGNSSAILDPWTMGVMGATLAVGVVFTYMSQNAWTDLRYIQDEHLAKRNAECNVQQKMRVHTIETEQSQTHRTDGRTWVKTVQANAGDQLAVAR